MTLTDRDRKIVLILVPLVLVGAFVFLVLKPKLGEASQAQKALDAARHRRDEMVAREEQLRSAKQTFAVDYTTVVRLGKAVPTQVDMPSVLVQLEQAAKGTHINFDKIEVGARIPAAGSSQSGSSGGSSSGSSSGGSSSGSGGSSSSGGSGSSSGSASSSSSGSSGGGSSGGSTGGGSSSSSTPVAASGPQGQSGAGKATGSANNAAPTASSGSSGSQGANSQLNTQVSTSTRKGGLPVGGGSTSSGLTASGPAPVPGLDTVPLDLQFTGDFFDLADFFHSLKRFVHVANQQLIVRGRLLTIDAFSFDGGQNFPKIKASIKARIFLAPEQQGATAGASPAGPSAPAGTATASTSGTGGGTTPTASVRPSTGP